MNVEMKGVQNATCLLPKNHESGNETVDFVFCSTNASTAQSYNGDLWVDEFAWIPNASKLMDTAAGMTANKKYQNCLYHNSKHNQFIRFSNLERT